MEGALECFFEFMAVFLVEYKAGVGRIDLKLAESLVGWQWRYKAFRVLRAGEVSSGLSARLLSLKELVPVGESVKKGT